MCQHVRDSFVEGQLDTGLVVKYLAHLGLGHVDPVKERIGCWTCLQEFVASRSVVKPLTQSIRDTRLKTYGFERVHPVGMFIRHVLY